MTKEDLKLYYFQTIELKRISDTYFSKIKEFIDVKEFFNNCNLTEDERVNKCCNMENKICEYIRSDKAIEEDFFKAYHLKGTNTLCEFVLQGIVANEVINNKIEINIFLDKASVLYFNGEFPLNIKLWKKDKNETLIKHCEFYNKLYELFKK